jgi:hypothetical protein
MSQITMDSNDNEIRQYRCIVAHDHFRITLFGYRGLAYATLLFSDVAWPKSLNKDDILGEKFLLPASCYRACVDMLRYERPLFYRGKPNLIMETLQEPVGEHEGK